MTKDQTEKIVTEGSIVTIKIGEKFRIITIVSTTKVNAALGYISAESPLGKAIIGLKEGDITTFINPIGKVVFVEIATILEQVS